MFNDQEINRPKMVIMEDFSVYPLTADPNAINQHEVPPMQIFRDQAITPQEEWILNVFRLESNKLLLAGDATGRDDFGKFAKQVVLEKMLKRLEKWYHDDEAKSDDVLRHMQREFDRLDEKCDYCLMTGLTLKRIEIRRGQYPEWYRPPTELNWLHRNCSDCDRVITRTHLM